MIYRAINKPNIFYEVEGSIIHKYEFIHGYFDYLGVTKRIRHKVIPLNVMDMYCLRIVLTRH